MNRYTHTHRCTCGAELRCTCEPDRCDAGRDWACPTCQNDALDAYLTSIEISRIRLDINSTRNPTAYAQEMTHESR
jgi:hypothetical protein